MFLLSFNPPSDWISLPLSPFPLLSPSSLLLSTLYRSPSISRVSIISVSLHSPYSLILWLLNASLFPSLWWQHSLHSFDNWGNSWRSVPRFPFERSFPLDSFYSVVPSSSSFLLMTSFYDQPYCLLQWGSMVIISSLISSRLLHLQSFIPTWIINHRILFPFFICFLLSWLSNLSSSSTDGEKRRKWSFFWWRRGGKTGERKNEWEHENTWLFQERSDQLICSWGIDREKNRGVYGGMPSIGGKKFFPWEPIPITQFTLHYSLLLSPSCFHLAESITFSFLTIGNDEI